MEMALKVVAVAIVGAICTVVVKKNVQEMGIVLALAAGVVILTFSLGAIESVRSMMDILADAAGLAPAVLAPVVKTVGIAIVTRIAAEICRDAKESGIAAFVETAGSAMALFVSLPLLQAVLTTVAKLL